VDAHRIKTGASTSHDLAIGLKNRTVIAAKQDILSAKHLLCLKDPGNNSRISKIFKVVLKILVLVKENVK
jgi:hypothetical protein